MIGEDDIEGMGGTRAWELTSDPREGERQEGVYMKVAVWFLLDILGPI